MMFNVDHNGLSLTGDSNQTRSSITFQNKIIHSQVNQRSILIIIVTYCFCELSTSKLDVD